MDRHCTAGSSRDSLCHSSKTIRASRIIKDCLKFFNHVAIFLIRGLRPLLGPAHCRYELSCSRYAIKQLQEEFIVTALFRICKRLLLCNPLYNPNE